MKSKLETAATDVLLFVDTNDLLQRERTALRALQQAVESPWYTSHEYPTVPQGSSSVEVLGFVADGDPPVIENDSVQIVSFWKSWEGMKDVWTLSVTSVDDGSPYDMMVAVSSWHPIPARRVRGA